MSEPTMRDAVIRAIIDFDWYGHGLPEVDTRIHDGDPDYADDWKWVGALAASIVAAVTAGPEVP
jgi:hypothetical protein